MFLFKFFTRPQLDSQNTGREVYQRPVSVANVTVNGLGGASNFGSLNPFSPTSINLRMVTPASITGSGNALNTNPNLDPLNNAQF